MVSPLAWYSLTHKLGLDGWPASPRVLPVCILPCIRMTSRSHHSQVFLVASGGGGVGGITLGFSCSLASTSLSCVPARAWNTGHDFFHTKNGFYGYIMSQHRVKSRFKNSIATCKCSLWSVASMGDRTEVPCCLAPACQNYQGKTVKEIQDAWAPIAPSPAYWCGSPEKGA